MVNNKNINLQHEYSHEISEISYIMQNLEQGRIYEKTGAKMDGYLATNICNLRKLLNSMLVGIQKNELEIQEPIEEVFRSY